MILGQTAHDKPVRISPASILRFQDSSGLYPETGGDDPRQGPAEGNMLDAREGAHSRVGTRPARQY